MTEIPIDLSKMEEYESITAINAANIPINSVIKEFMKTINILRETQDETNLYCTKLEAKNDELRAKGKVADKWEADPISHLLNVYAPAHNIDFRFSERVVRNKGLGGRWTTFPELMEFRKVVKDNAHLFKHNNNLLKLSPKKKK